MAYVDLEMGIGSVQCVHLGSVSHMIPGVADGAIVVVVVVVVVVIMLLVRAAHCRNLARGSEKAQGIYRVPGTGVGKPKPK